MLPRLLRIVFVSLVVATLPAVLNTSRFVRQFANDEYSLKDLSWRPDNHLEPTHASGKKGGGDNLALRLVEQKKQSSREKLAQMVRRKSIITRQVRRPSNATLAAPCGQPMSAAADQDSCGAYRFPVTPYFTPAKCWPRVVLLPSFPTSGNGLVHHTFEKLTGLVAFAIYDTRGPLGFVTTSENHEAVSLFYDNNQVCPASSSPDSLAIASTGRVALTKTHLPVDNDYDESMAKVTSTELQKKGEIGGGVSAVVRLARNPGDHILRNAFRWKSKGCNGDDCFFEMAKATCPTLVRDAHRWSRFHDFWNQYDPSVPQIVLHYEAVSDPTAAPNAFRRLLQFVGEKEQHPGTLEAKVKAMVSEPSYEHGSLVAQVCGVSMANKINSITQQQSERLGYGFNKQTGKWTLSQT